MTMQVTVTVAAVNCVYQLTSAKQVNFGAGGGTGTATFTQTMGTNCTWTATASVAFPWISVQDPGGSGHIVVRYTVGANSSPSQREGRIEVRWPGSQQGENITISQAAAVSGDTVVPFRQIASGGHNNNQTPQGIRVVRDQASWTSFLGTVSLSSPSGSIDFASEMAIVVSYGSRTLCGAKTQIDRVIERAGAALDVFAVTLMLPASCEFPCAQAVSSQFDVIVVRKSSQPVAGTWSTRVSTCVANLIPGRDAPVVDMVSTDVLIPQRRQCEINPPNSCSKQSRTEDLCVGD